MAEQITRAIIVKGPVARIYRLWEDVERFPAFMPEIKSVMKTGKSTFLWTVRGPSGKDVRWEARVTRKEKNTRIAWNTLIGEIQVSGQVTFQQLPQEETQVTVVLEYVLFQQTPGFEKARLEDPGQRVLEALRNFKRYAEHTVPSHD